MSRNDNEQMYPDALGAISRGQRADLDAVQAALGVFPRQAFLNQPLELVVLLQNMVDRATEVKVTIKPPVSDRNGDPIVLDMPKQNLSANLQAGEVGVMRIPVIAFPPTQPGSDIPIHVTIHQRGSRRGRAVRPRAGGFPPRSFAVSAHKLQALRDISYTAQLVDGNVLTTTFDIAPKRIDMAQYSLVARYETLWTTEQMAGEREHFQSKVEQARALASIMTTTSLYWSLYYATEDKWSQRGVHLGAGELKALTKIMTYTLSDATLNERDLSLESTRWFQMLCHALLAEPDLSALEPGVIAAEYLYDTAVYDAVLLGFSILDPRVSVKLGSESERTAYAEKLTNWLVGGFGQGELSYLYLPLVLAGLAVNVLVAASTESPWVMLDELRADAKVRAANAGAAGREIFAMLESLLESAEHELTRMNYVRPEPE